MSKKLAVIIGAGAGMGNHIAERFAKENFRVVLVARRKSTLDEYVAEFSAKGYEAYARTADVSDTASLTNLFADIHENLGVVDVLIYNAAFMQNGRISQISADELNQHFQIDVAGALHCVNLVLPKQLEQGKGTLLFTGGLFGIHPNESVDYSGLSIGKVALRSLTLLLNTELKNNGIFTGIVQIMGVVGSNEHFSPKNIADAYWKLYTDRNSFEYFFD